MSKQVRTLILAGVAVVALVALLLLPNFLPADLFTFPAAVGKMLLPPPSRTLP